MVRFAIYNNITGLFWDETCKLFRQGGFVPLYLNEEDALNTIKKDKLSNCEVVKVNLYDYD